MNQKIVVATSILKQMLTGEHYNLIVAALLRRVDRKRPLGTPLHSATLGLMPGIAFEAVGFREGQNGTEAYLRQRGSTEPSFRGYWHYPGSFFRNKERREDVMERLVEECGVKIGVLRDCGTHVWEEDERNTTVHSHIHLVEYLNPPLEDETHRWFPLEKLPQSMIPEHAGTVLSMALKFYHSERCEK